MKMGLKNITVVVIAVVLLGTGFGAGCGIGLVIYQPQIDSLQGQISGLVSRNANLTSQITDLRARSLSTEADYVIFVDDVGTTYAKNGSTGKIDYNSTDASAVINSAIVALPETGGLIFVKEGTYAISATIKVQSNVVLIGAGFSSKLVVSTSLLNDLILNSDRDHGNDNILITNLHLDGNKAQNPAARTGGITFSKVRNSTIQNCWIHDFGFSGVHLFDGGGNVVQNNFVFKNRNAGIEGTNEEYDIVANNVVYSNEGYPYGYGIDYCTGSRHNILDGNVCSNNGLTSGGGLSLWDGYENTIVNNILTSNYVGVAVGIPSFGNETYGNLIIGNMVSNNTVDGLHMEGENNLVSKNTFTFNGGNGVYINGSGTKNIAVEGNRMENNQGWQICVTAFPSDTIIKNNLLCGNDLIRNQGTNTLIKWNSGYNTENSGTAVIQTGRINISLEHDLVSKPTLVNLTPKDNLESRSYWYTANGTHITIYISSPDANNNHWFDWSAET